MVVFPNAKINLGLQIIRKRSDEYHDLQTCFYPIPYYDVLEIVPSANDSFHSAGISIDGSNLVEKAIASLRKQYPFPCIEANLIKNIPIGSGLGGGSSDAAFALKGINELFDLKIPLEKLEEISATIGKDCPFFIRNKPLFASNTGDTFEDIKITLNGYFIVVVTPPIHISTKEAFLMVRQKEPINSLKYLLENNRIPDWDEKIINDFQSVIEEKFPEIKEARRTLIDSKALYSSLSGSGSSVFGIFDFEPDFSDTFPGYKVWSSKV